MPTFTTSNIFVIGGTGAQGMPIIRALVADGKYAVRVLTRDPESPRAKELLALGNVSLLEGSFADEAILREGFSACDGAFVNLDGFNTGEKTETYWAIRAYEVALEQGVRFFVYGNLDYALKKSGFDSSFRTGHYDGKGRMGEWIRFQTQSNKERMGAAIFTSGPYIEMAISAMTPMSPTVEDGVATWRVPLGEGAVPHVALEDCGYYVRWLFDHPQLANGMDLEVAIEHVAYAKLAAAFEKVTGHPARYIDTDLSTYWKGPFGRQEHDEHPGQLHRLLERLEARHPQAQLRPAGRNSSRQNSQCRGVVEKRGSAWKRSRKRHAVGKSPGGKSSENSQGHRGHETGQAVRLVRKPRALNYLRHIKSGLPIHR
jgi:hypothetical protein